jgi:hypothetical protein
MDLTKAFVEEATKAGYCTRSNKKTDQSVEMFLSKAKNMIEVL